MLYSSDMNYSITINRTGYKMNVLFILSLLRFFTFYLMNTIGKLSNKVINTICVQTNYRNLFLFNKGLEWCSLIIYLTENQLYHFVTIILLLWFVLICINVSIWKSKKNLFYYNTSPHCLKVPCSQWSVLAHSQPGSVPFALNTLLVPQTQLRSIHLPIRLGKKPNTYTTSVCF